MSRDIIGWMEYFVYKNAYPLYKKVLLCRFFIPPLRDGYATTFTSFTRFWLCLTPMEEKKQGKPKPPLFRYNTHATADECRLQLFYKVRPFQGCGLSQKRFSTNACLSPVFPPVAFPLPASLWESNVAMPYVCCPLIRSSST